MSTFKKRQSPKDFTVSYKVRHKIFTHLCYNLSSLTCINFTEAQKLLTIPCLKQDNFFNLFLKSPTSPSLSRSPSPPSNLELIYMITSPLTLARFASLTVCHVVQDILHGSAMREVALSHLPVGLFSTLTLVSM